MKHIATVLMLILGLGSTASSEMRTITGQVTDQQNQQPIPAVTVSVTDSPVSTTTDLQGRFTITVESQHTALMFSHAEYASVEVILTKVNHYEVQLAREGRLVRTSPLLHQHVESHQGVPRYEAAVAMTQQGGQRGMTLMPLMTVSPYSYNSTESYRSMPENKYFYPTQEPLSTFAVDVDAASYSNVRRFINSGQLPPQDAVRIEEMINYFEYELQGPSNNDPVAIHTELSTAPWNPVHHLLRIGLKAKSMDTKQLPPSNLVFLIDVSGSMAGANRLPLVKTALKMLVDQLRDTDRVAIVTYASSATVTLESTPASEKNKIKDAIEALHANGMTAGGQGIRLAYQTAGKHLIPKGNNRVILASDGDFNVGPSSDSDMETLIARERQRGISLSVLGFGMGNYQDSKLEILANQGHGNYAYIDNLSEARKAMVNEFGGTLYTVAKDVKVQVEFNPANVLAYRLIGYENRMLSKEDFNNDHKLGGDMGVAHVVTALYEIVPENAQNSFIGSVDPLKYQPNTTQPSNGYANDIATVKFRYKDPNDETSKLKQAVVVDRPLPLEKTTDDFRFASAVAELGMLLRHSPYKQQADFDHVITRARHAKGEDKEGYRAEFVTLAENARLLAMTNDLAGTNR